MTREPIYAALFALLAAAPGLVTTSRRLQHWGDVPAASQPALFMEEQDETATTQTGLPSRWTLAVDVYLYVRSDGGAAPGPIMNPLLDYIVQALAYLPGQYVQTLGGLVAYARIDGNVKRFQSVLDSQAVAMIPIKILST